MAAPRAADTLTLLRALCGVLLAFRPSLTLLVVGVASDWLDGPLARRAGPSPHGARFDLEADSILTLGAGIAAVRRGAPAVLLLAPLARYAVAAIRPSLTSDERRWDRFTGVAQMIVLALAIARVPLGWSVIPASAARAAALAAQARAR